VDIEHLFAIVVGNILVTNFVLARFLGLCPFIGVSRRTSSAFGMGMAVTFVMTIASLASWLLYTYLLKANAPLLVALLNPTDAPEPLALGEAVLQGFCAGVGFTLAMLLMSGIRERLELVDVPKPLRGVPIAFVCTGLIALAFLGFTGMA
jgi:electron transport complex protein RnfA